MLLSKRGVRMPTISNGASRWHVVAFISVFADARVGGDVGPGGSGVNVSRTPLGRVN